MNLKDYGVFKTKIYVRDSKHKFHKIRTFYDYEL